MEEARELVPGAEVVAVSAKTGAGLPELTAALARAADLVFQKHKVDDAGPPLRRPRVLAARDRDGRDRDALVGVDRGR